MLELYASQHVNIAVLFRIT